MRTLLILLLAAAAVALWLARTPDPPVEQPTERVLAALASDGEYLLRAAGCTVCHTQDGAGETGLLAGGRPIESPFGVFYSPNITPDVATGIGGWTAQDFVRALRHGRSPSGAAYFPSFPYTSYSAMPIDDMLAIYAYLRTVPARRQANRAHELRWYLNVVPAARLWQALFFSPAEWQPDPARSGSANRGAYLANALGHCPECHTPRNALGVLDTDRHLAGTATGPDGDPVPNITPDRDTGIGRWRARDLRDFLASGMTPDGDFTGGLMSEVVDGSLQHLSRDDLQALVDYLRDIPPIARQVVRRDSDEER